MAQCLDCIHNRRITHVPVWKCEWFHNAKAEPIIIYNLFAMTEKQLRCKTNRASCHNMRTGRCEHKINVPMGANKTPTDNSSRF